MLQREISFVFQRTKAENMTLVSFKRVKYILLSGLRLSRIRVIRGFKSFIPIVLFQLRFERISL